MSLFDATNVSTTGVEDGEHVIIVDDAEVKESKSGGEYINIRWRLESNGTTFYAMYNIKNDNKKAVDIGLGHLKKLMLAAGVEPKASGVDELIGLRVLARLKNKEDDYGDKVEIKSYKKAPEASLV
jgi:hypothetical protein